MCVHMCMSECVRYVCLVHVCVHVHMCVCMCTCVCVQKDLRTVQNVSIRYVIGLGMVMYVST
jgi:hypothetical protein